MHRPIWTKLRMSSGARRSMRIAVNTNIWKPTQEEWVLANQCIDTEEKDRIAKFMFQRDSKASIVGQLLIRKVLSDLTARPFKDFLLTRTEKGKPILKNSDVSFAGSFNVAHHGHYTVIAADSDNLVGVDVMTLDFRKDINRFFSTMRRQLTENEWSTVEGERGDHNRMTMFNRMWCLKESYVKAIGTGIGFELNRINFNVPTKCLSTSVVTSDTSVQVDGQLRSDWLFEEMLLDNNHCTAVATCFNNTSLVEKHSCSSFKFLQVQQLLQECQALPGSIPDLDNWLLFSRKDEMPQGKS